MPDSTPYRPIQVVTPAFHAAQGGPAGGPWVPPIKGAWVPPIKGPWVPWIKGPWVPPIMTDGNVGMQGRVGLGWQPETSDFRDRTVLTPGVVERVAEDYRKRSADRTKALAAFRPAGPVTAVQEPDFKNLLAAGDGYPPPKRQTKGKAAAVGAALPPAHSLLDIKSVGLDCDPDLWPVENQGELGSCTAQAVVGLLEYLIRRQRARDFDFSRLFLYKTTRRLLGWVGDTGAYIRSTIKAAARFGIPPEEYWPYDVYQFDADPDGFLYSFASLFKCLSYARLDGYGAVRDGFASAGQDTLDLVKRTLLDGFPVAFGFSVYASLNSTRPDIPYPRPGERQVGGHAVLAVGYDDERENLPLGVGGKGALLVRNSWGSDWGDRGYGWLPYKYVTEQLALDFWTAFNQEWVDDQPFDV